MRRAAVPLLGSWVRKGQHKPEESASRCRLLPLSGKLSEVPLVHVRVRNVGSPTLTLHSGPMWWSQQLVTEKTPHRSDPELTGMRLGDRYRKRLDSLETRSWKACHRDCSQWKCRGAVALCRTLYQEAEER